MAQRVSAAAKDLSKGGFIREGIFKIMEAEYVGHQFNQSEESIKRGNDPSEPVVAIRFGVQKLNEELNPIDDTVEDLFLPIAWPKKDSNKKGRKDDDGHYIFACYPATAKNQDDNEPEIMANALGDDEYSVTVGASGNCLMADANFKIWAESPWGRFAATLEAPGGLKPAINALSYAPVYVGMVIDVHTIEVPKAPNAKADAKTPTALVCKKIHVFPGQPGAGKANAGAKKSGAGAGSKANGAAKESAPAQAMAAANGAAADDKRSLVLKEFVAANTGKTLKRSEFQKAIGPFGLGKKMSMAEAQALANSLKNDTTLGEVVFEFGIEASEDLSELTFA